MRDWLVTALADARNALLFCIPSFLFFHFFSPVSSDPRISHQTLEVFLTRADGLRRRLQAEAGAGSDRPPGGGGGKGPQKGTAAEPSGESLDSETVGSLRSTFEVRSPALWFLGPLGPLVPPPTRHYRSHRGHTDISSQGIIPLIESKLLCIMCFCAKYGFTLPFA